MVSNTLLAILGQWLEILGGMPFGKMQQIQMLMRSMLMLIMKKIATFPLSGLSKLYQQAKTMDA